MRSVPNRACRLLFTENTPYWLLSQFLEAASFYKRKGTCPIFGPQGLRKGRECRAFNRRTKYIDGIMSIFPGVLLRAFGQL